MPKITVQDLPYQQAAPHVNWLVSYSLYPSPPIQDADLFLENLKQTETTTRHMVLFEGEKAAACAAAGEMVQNVRGKLIPASGIFRVSTHPAARRKGYAFRVLSELLKAERLAGRPLTCLYPFRESFYARLGYVSFPLGVKAHFNINGFLPLVKQGWGENIELVEYLSAPERYSKFIDAFLQHTHGMAKFVTETKPNPEKHKYWLAFARSNDKVDGMILYSLDGTSPTKYTFNINNFYYRTVAARTELLGWIGRHIDQANQVVIRLPVYERPNTWCTDIDLQIEANWIAPMARILDIAKLNGIPTGPGKFKAKVTDPVCPWNEGVWKFESLDGKLSVTPDHSPDCHLEIQGLTALLYGTNPVKDFSFLGWGDPTEELEQEMESMFPLASPHIHSFF